MASSMSGQGGTNSCTMIGYLSRQDGAILLPCDYPLCPERKPFPGSHVISCLLSLFNQDGSRPQPCLVLFCGSMGIGPISVHKHAKKNLANIQLP